MMDNVALKDKLLKNKELLKNMGVRDMLFESSYHYAFVWVVQELDDYSFVSDSDMVRRILSDDRCTDKLCAIITSGLNIGSFLDNDDILNKVFSSSLVNDLSSLNYSSACPVMNYMLKNGFERYFCNFSHSVQNRFLSNDKIFTLLINSSGLPNILVSVDQVGFDCLMKSDMVKNYLLGIGRNHIKRLVNNGIAFPLDVSLDERFINWFLDISDVSSYRILIDKLMKNNGMSVDEIEKRRFKDYDAIISDYSDGYSYLSRLIISNIRSGKNINSLVTTDLRYYALREKSIINEELLYKYDCHKFRDILIDRFFGDIPVNFLKNLSVMVNYADKISSNYDKKRFDIYRSIIGFDGLSFDERMNLYNCCKSIPDLCSLFYDDYRFFRNHSYSSLVNNAIDLNSFNENCPLKRSEIYGVNVYELNGEDFFAFVHTTGVSRSFVSDPNIWHDGKREFMSLSYIGSDNLNVFKDPYENIVLGFSGLDYNRIGHLYESDSFTKYGYGNKDVSNRVQKMYTSGDFVNNTKGYNEVAYLEDSKDIPLSNVMPSYVVCYDYIDDGDVLVAKNYNIPIVLINTKKYKFKNDSIVFDDNDTYVL